jgi:hypothetical protein
MRGVKRELLRDFERLLDHRAALERNQRFVKESRSACASAG